MATIRIEKSHPKATGLVVETDKAFMIVDMYVYNQGGFSISIPGVSCIRFGGIMVRHWHQNIETL